MLAGISSALCSTRFASAAAVAASQRFSDRYSRFRNSAFFVARRNPGDSTRPYNAR